MNKGPCGKSSRHHASGCSGESPGRQEQALSKVESKPQTVKCSPPAGTATTWRSKWLLTDTRSSTSEFADKAIYAFAEFISYCTQFPKRPSRSRRNGPVL